MSSVDKRVVEMQFENKDFLSRIGDSLAAVTKLKEGLSFNDALNSLTRASNKFSLDGVEKSIDTLTNKFSVMHFAGIAAITNLTNEAVNMSKRVAASLTTDPISKGFEEYETQINAVQTILANTQKEGTNITTVNAALDELNAYADKTIYNFTEMTKNIGTFTAAGVKMDTSVQAIKGIANLAAVSGSNSQQASTAMYQLSQALSTGTVKLMDWNSVVNAGMGGQVFQDALKQTAIVHGVNVDKIIKKEGSFRDSLSTGWLSSTILLETLNKFTGDLSAEQLKQMGYSEKQIPEILKLGQTANDAATKVKTLTQLMDTLKEAAQSGWSQTWRTIVGDFEEARTLFTWLSNTFGAAIGKSAQARNEMLKGWADLGGRRVLIKGIQNVIEAVLKVTNAVGEAFRSIFPPMTSKRLYDITVMFIRFTRAITPSEETLSIMKRTLRGLFSFVKIGVDVLKLFAQSAWLVLKEFSPLVDMILGAIVAVGEFGNKLRVSTYQTDTFGNALEFVKGVIKNIKVILGQVSTDLAATTPGIQAYVDKFYASLIELKDKIYTWAKNLDPNTIQQILNAGIIGTILFFIKRFIDAIKKLFGEGSKFAEAITGVLDEVRSSLEMYQTSLKAKVIEKIAIAIAILAGALLLLSFVDKDKLVRGLTALTIVFIELFGAMILFGKFAQQDGFTNVKKVATAMIGVSIAILILAFALDKLSKIKFEDPKSLIYLSGLLLVLSKFVDSVKNSSGDMIKTAVGITILAGALLILTISIERLSLLSFMQLASGLGAIIISLAAITRAMRQLPKDMPSLSMKLLGVSSAMYVMAQALIKMSGMSVGELTKALVTLSISLYAITTAINSINAKDAITGSMAILTVSIGLMALATSFKILSSIDPKALFIVIGALAATFAVIAAGAYAISFVVWPLLALTLFIGTLGTSLFLVGAGLAAFAAGLAILVPSLALLAVSLPFIFQKMAEGIVLMIDVFIKSIYKISDLIYEFVKAIVTGLARAAGVVAKAISDFIIDFLKTIFVYMPAMILTGAKLILSFLQGITDHIFDIVAVGIEVVLKFIDGVASKMGDIVMSAVNLIISFTNGLADAIIAKAPLIRAAVWKLIVAIATAIVGFYNDISLAISNLVSEMVSKLNIYVSQKWEELKGIGRNMMEGLKQGILDMASDIANAAKNVVSWAVDGVKKFLKIKSPSRVFMEIGEFMNAGLVKGINSTANSVKDSVVETGSLAVNAMSKAISKINELALSDMYFNPVITPVIDLSNVNSGISKLNSDLSANRSLSIGASVSAANTISRSQNGIDLSEVPQSASNSNTYIFNQTNNSPKALSRIDIYRQTKNQFATLKGLVEGT